MATTTATLGPARDHLCVRCGRPAQSWQHRVAKGRGGPTDRFNCWPVCGDGTRGCHEWAESRVLAAQSVGLDVAGSFVRSDPGCCTVYVGPNESYRERYNDGGHRVGCDIAAAVSP